MKRLREAKLEFDVNDERVLREVALFADRCDVTEEVTRLRSHFDQFSALLKSDGEVGRKGEFILQEIGREVMDRTMVILEIFHRHASSRFARAQVEIARLGYMAPRLREQAKLKGPVTRKVTMLASL